MDRRREQIPHRKAISNHSVGISYFTTTSTEYPNDVLYGSILADTKDVGKEEVSGC
jgi:hypothetical protein